MTATISRPSTPGPVSDAVREALRTPDRMTMRRTGRDPFAADLGRRRVAGAIAAVGIGGLLFGPTFGSTLATAVVTPVLAVAVAVYAVFELGLAVPALRVLRVPIALVVGLVVTVETALPATTANAVPTRSSVTALTHAVTRGWYETLQTTSPAVAHQRLVAFVPLLVLAAAILAMELADRGRNRSGMLPAAPRLVVGLLAEGYHPLSTVHAAAAVAAFALAASAAGGYRPSVRTTATLMVATLAGAFVASWADPVDAPHSSLRDHVGAVRSEQTATGPLDDIAYQVAHPGVPMFNVRFDRRGEGADRWPLASYAGFTGSNWVSDGRLRYLGGGVQAPSVSTPTETHSARIVLDNLQGQWLPSQHGLTDVDGVDALVDESSGAVLGRGVPPNSDYALHWRSPKISAADLDDARLELGSPVDRRIDQLSMGDAPPQIRDLLAQAVGRGGPTLRTALVLERWFQRHYRVSSAAPAQTGLGWLDIVRFLTTTDAAAGSGSDVVRGSGTSEQFAAAYTAMAKLVGIQARLVVGFQQPTHAQPDGSYVVRSDNMTAWPEIAVQGIGWIPMQPMGLPADNSDRAGGTSTPVTRATEQLRDKLPAGRPPAASSDDVAADGGTSILVTARDSLRGIGVVLVVLVLLLLVAIPGTKFARAVARRRRVGSDAVLAAWRETCDLLLDRGVPLEHGMTVRDVVETASPTLDEPALRAMEELVELVDEAVWSGDTARPHIVAAAWKAADEVRFSLTGWPLVERVAAGLAVHSLRPDRAPMTYLSRV